MSDLKWREWWITENKQFSDYYYAADKDYIIIAPNQIPVIEAAPALARIEKLELENKYYSEELSKLHRKLNEMKKGNT